MLQLTREQFEQIIQQGLEGKPLEICGLLAGAAHPPLEGESVGHTVVEVVYPIESDDKSELTYTLNATQYLKAIKDIEARGLQVVGIYHTHPATEAFPSKTDVARAHWGDTDDLLFPEYSYLIVSLRDPQNPEPHSFKIRGRDIPGDIVEEPVAVI
jgi:[CysO sulfur-carrier protein]-S-L-cysteine hydrolase